MGLRHNGIVEKVTEIGTLTTIAVAGHIASILFIAGINAGLRPRRRRGTREL